MLFLPVPFDRRGFTNLYEQVSAGQRERLLFGDFTPPSNVAIPAGALIGSDQFEMPSITTVEFSAGAVPVRRISLFLNDLVVEHGRLDPRGAGEPSEELVARLLAGELPLRTVTAPNTYREDTYQRVANVALQLNQHQV